MEEQDESLEHPIVLKNISIISETYSLQIAYTSTDISLRHAVLLTKKFISKRQATLNVLPRFKSVALTKDVASA